MAARPYLIGSTALAAGLLLLPIPAMAQDADAPLWVRSQSSRVGLEVDLWPNSYTFEFGPSSTTLTILAFGFTPVAQIGITRNVFLTAELPFYMVHASVESTVVSPGEPTRTESDSQTELAIGNPTVGAYYATMFAPELALRFGGSLSAPVHFDPSTETSIALIAGGARAFYDTHRYVPEALPVRAQAGAEYEVTPRVHLRGEAGPVLLVPLDGQDTELLLENAVEIDYLTEGGLGGGARLQAVVVFTDSDKIQTAAELFFLYEAPARVGAFARAGFLLALDENAGFGFDQGKVATLRLSGGGKF